MPAFVAPVDYSVGWSPSEVKTGDFNGDDIPDLATLDGGGNSVSVLLGNGDGTFQPAHSSYAGGGWPSLAVGDFNEDGQLDLATSSNFYSEPYPYGIDDVVVLIGHGDGSFASPVYLGTDLPAQFVATGDLNGDDHIDLVVTAWDDDAQEGSLNVLLGGGDGTFAVTTTHPLYGFGPTPALADFDADGNTDVALGDQLFLSNGDGTLREPSHIGDYVYWGATVADFDGDGNFDLAGTNFGSTSVLRGNGDGTFQPPRSAAPEMSLLTADVNGDGVPDLVGFTSGGPTPYLTALLGNGDGSFGLPIATAIGFGANALAVADLNADGLADAAVASSPGWDSGLVSVFLNDGVWTPPPPPPPALRIGDRTVTEGNTGTASVTFTVTLSAASTQPVTVAYATGNGTATAGSDYRAASGTLTFAPGETTKTITVPVDGDRLAEPNETFVVNLGSPTNATIADAQGVGAILDDEPRVSISDVTKSEGKKNQTTLFTFTVTLSAAYDQPVTVSFRTANGTATTGDNDFTAKTGTITFLPGETTKTITVEVKGDSKKEGTEYFYLDLFGASGNSLFTKSRGTGTVLNDD